MKMRPTVNLLKKEKIRGFTVVETVVAVIAFALFFTAIFQVYMAMESQRNISLEKSIAYELAGINLKKFPTRPAGLTVCSTDPNGIDLKAYNSYSDETSTTYPALASLGTTSNTTQAVKGFPLGGCNGTAFASDAFQIVSTVTYFNGTTTAQAIRVTIVNVGSGIQAPTITSVSPSSGSTAGGTSVVITGTNMTGATAVTFGATAATSYTVNSATQITATTPANTAGAVSVAVTTAGGTATSANAFTYNALAVAYDSDAINVRSGSSGTCSLNTTATGAIIVLVFHTYGLSNTLTVTGTVNGVSMTTLGGPIAAHPYGPSVFGTVLGLANVSAGAKNISINLPDSGTSGIWFHCIAYKAVTSFGTVASGSNITSLAVPARASPFVWVGTTMVGRSYSTYSLATASSVQRTHQLYPLSGSDVLQLQMADVSNAAAHTWTMTNLYGTSMFAVPLNL